MSNAKKPEVKRPQSFKEYIESMKDTVSVFGWLYKNVTTRESKREMALAVGLIAFSTVIQAIQPGALAYVFDGLREHHREWVIGGIAVFLVALVGQKVQQRFFDRGREVIIGTHLGKIDDVLSSLFFGKSLAQHAQHAHLLSASTIDKGKWKSLDLQRLLIFDFIPTMLQLMFSIACLFWINWIAGAIMAFVLAAYVVGSLYLNSEVARVCAPLDTEFRRINRRRFERMERVERVVNNAMEEYEVKAMSKEFDKVIAEDRKFWFWFIDFAVGRSGINVLGLVSVMSLGAWLVWSGQISLGLLYPLYSWATKVSDNVWKLGDVEHQINWLMPAVKSMIEAVSIPPEVIESEGATDIDPSVPHRIELVGIGHAYPAESGIQSDAPAAIRGISLTIEPGERVSLLGPSGAGKTTVMKKLLRYGNPTTGKILVDGIDLRGITLRSWRRGIGYIPQQAQVLDGTVRYNLVYGLSEAEREVIADDELWRIMKLLEIDFGERLTEGLDTVVGKNGIKLSGGQAQRLMIGAAVIKKPWLLIIDEATSSLDSTTEKAVQKGLEMLLKGTHTSALVVAHRLNTVQGMCNKHVVLRPVSAVSEGESQVDASAPCFVSLAEQSPVFRRLAEDQGLQLLKAAFAA